MIEKMIEKKWGVAVVGGGVVGCATARELSRYDIETVVLESEAEIAMGASEANSGLVHAGYDPIPGTNKARFNVLGARMYPELCRELSVPFVNNGALVVAYNEEERRTLDELLERGHENGVEELSIVEGAQLRALEPSLSTEVVAALYVPTSGIVCPYGITFALADHAALNGVTFLREHKVLGIEKQEDGFVITTNAGVIRARAVVNAAGLYSDVINNMVSEDKLTIKPKRGEYWLVDRAYEREFKQTIFRTPTALGKGILVTPTVDGTLLIGPTAEETSGKSDVSTTAAGLDTVFEQASLIWPRLKRSMLIASFAGNRAKGDRGDFVVGEAKDVPMFYNAAAIESPGLTSAPAIGKYLAECIAEKLSARKKDNFVPFVPPVKPFVRMTDEQRRQAVAENPDYAAMVCRCETVTEAEIRDCIRRPVGARTVDGVKHRTRVGMGRCQGGFCTPRVVDILCEELGIEPDEVTKSGKGSELLVGRIGGVSE